MKAAETFLVVLITMGLSIGLIYLGYLWGKHGLWDELIRRLEEWGKR